MRRDATVDDEQQATPDAEDPGHQEPAALLSEMRMLRRQARATRRGYWFPLVLFGLLGCGCIPFYLWPGPGHLPGFLGGPAIAPSTVFLGGYGGPNTDPYLAYYWLAALCAGLLLTLLWYQWHARRVGLATPARSTVITLAALLFLVIGIPPLARVPGLHWLSVLMPGDIVIRGTFPFLIVAVGLGVLAWAERSPALTVITVVFCGAALLSSLYDVENILFRFGWNPSPGQWRLTFLPNVLLPALVLLFAGAGAFAVQRPRRIPR